MVNLTLFLIIVLPYMGSPALPGDTPFLIGWEFFRDGWNIFHQPSDTPFMLLFNRAHSTRSLNSLSSDDTLILFQAYSERGIHSSALNGFTFQRPLLWNRISFKSGYDIYTSRASYDEDDITIHHSFIKTKTTDLPLKLESLLYHSDFDFPNYYTNIRNREEFNGIKGIITFHNFKLQGTYEQLYSRIDSDSKKRIENSNLQNSLTFGYNSFIIKVLGFYNFFSSYSFKKARYGGEIELENPYVGFKASLSKDDSLRNGFNLKGYFSFPLQNFILSPYAFTRLSFPNLLIESGIIPFYSLSLLGTKQRERESGLGIKIDYSDEIGLSADISFRKGNPIFVFAPSYVFDPPEFPMRFYRISDNFILIKVHNSVSYGAFFIRGFIGYINLNSPPPYSFSGDYSFSGEQTLGLTISPKTEVKTELFWTLRFTEEKNMSLTGIKVNFFDAVFIKFTYNNPFAQEYNLFPNYPFEKRHFRFILAARIPG